MHSTADSQQPQTFKVEPIGTEEACRLLERCQESQRLDEGGVRIHILHDDQEDELVLVQGSNGEFVTVKLR